MFSIRRFDVTFIFYFFKFCCCYCSSGTVPGTVLRRVHTAQLQLFQESIIIIISLHKGGVIYHVSTAYFLGKQLRVGDFETCPCVLLFLLKQRALESRRALRIYHHWRKLIAMISLILTASSPVPRRIWNKER